MLHAHADVFHVVGRSLAFCATHFEVVGLQEQHQVSRRWRAVDRTSVAVLEQHRKHAGVVKVRVGEHNSVQFVKRQRFWRVEKRHRIGVRSDVHAHVDHDTGFVGRHVVAGSTHFTVRTERSNTGPGASGTSRAVDVQTEVLQQFTALIPMGLAVHADVMNRFRKQGWRSLNLDGPAGFVPNGVAVLASTTNRRAGLSTLDDHFTVASVEVHLSDVGLLWNDGLNDVLGFVHVHHGLNGGAQHDLPLDASGDFADQTVLAREGLHVRRDDGNVASFQIDFIFDVARNDLRNLVFQFSVGHLHDVHFTLPQSAWTTAHSRGSDKRQSRGKMNLTSGVWQSRLARLVGSRHPA